MAYDVEAGVAVEADDFLDEYEEAFGEFDFESLGIDPNAPTEAKPGSEEKVMTLAARYAAGLPLWHDEDCYDHGPGAAFLEEFAELQFEFEEDE